MRFSTRLGLNTCRACIDLSSDPVLPPDLLCQAGYTDIERSKHLAHILLRLFFLPVPLITYSSKDWLISSGLLAHINWFGTSDLPNK